MSEYLSHKIVDFRFSNFNSLDFSKPTEGKENFYKIPFHTFIFESQNFKHVKSQNVDLAGATYETGTS